MVPTALFPQLVIGAFNLLQFVFALDYCYHKGRMDPTPLCVLFRILSGLSLSQKDSLGSMNILATKVILMCGSHHTLLHIYPVFTYQTEESHYRTPNMEAIVNEPVKLTRLAIGCSGIGLMVLLWVFWRRVRWGFFLKNVFNFYKRIVQCILCFTLFITYMTVQPLKIEFLFLFCKKKKI